MDIYLGNLNSPKTGKGFFLQRLANEFSISNSLKVIFDPMKKHDISLHITKIKQKTNARKNIIRFDGCLINISVNYKRANKSFKRSFNDADGIIYQTEFCKAACDKFIMPAKCKNNIIFNGADISFCDSVEPAEKRNKNIFITASRWRPQKRLKDIVETFLLSDIDDSILYVAGNLRKSGVDVKWKNKYLNGSKRVNYLGVLDQRTLFSYLKISNAFIHLSWIDWCPNSVVEAISSGVPVICNNVGGTQELVRPSNGIVCNIDKNYNMKPCKLYSPPIFNKNIVIDAMNRVCNENITINKDHIDIKNVARRYYNFFKEVLEDGS